MAYTEVGWQNGVAPYLYPGLLNMDAGVKAAHTRIPFIPVADYGAVANGTTDDATAINNAIAAANGHGNVVLMPGTHKINSRITIPPGVNLIGMGSGKADWGTRILCGSSSAGITIGGIGTDNRGGLTGGFTLDAASTSTQPFYIGSCVHRRFADIDIKAAAGTSSGLLIQQAQNLLFESVNIEDCANDNIRLDRGCGGLIFVRCEFNAAGAYNMRVTQSATDVFPYYPVPTHIAFHSCLWERRLNASTPGMVLINGGENITFNECVFADPDATSATNMVRVENTLTQNIAAAIRFNACTFTANTTYVTALSVGNGAMVSVKDPILLLLLNAIAVEAGARVDYAQGLMIPNQVTNLFAGAGAQDTWIRDRTRSPIEVTRTAAGDQLLLGLVNGEAGQRFLLDSTKLGWGPGTGFTQDVVLARTGTSALNITGNVSINAGTAITKHLSGTATWNPASLANGARESIAVTVTGAALGDTVAVGFTTAVPAGMIITGQVTAANTVTVTLYNINAGAQDLASGTVRADVWGH